jgi:hypothetical protein
VKGFDAEYEKKYPSAFCFALIKVNQMVHRIMDAYCLILTLAIYGVQIGIAENSHHLTGKRKRDMQEGGR